jgi:hypothetical protein
MFAQHPDDRCMVTSLTPIGAGEGNLLTDRLDYSVGPPSPLRSSLIAQNCLKFVGEEAIYLPRFSNHDF